MPQPSNILFQAISSMTGGLINDLTTAMLGMVVLGFLVFGVNYLKDIFEDSIARRETSSSLERSRSYKKMSESMDDQVSKDDLNAKYCNEIRRAAQ